MKPTTAVLAALVGAVVLAVGGSSPAPPVHPVSLVEVANFGSNPGDMRMHVYVPDSRGRAPAVVVALHGCGMSGPGFHSGSEFASLADRYGFIVIFPSATHGGTRWGPCFDTWSEAAKRRDGGSDPVSIRSMITYVEQRLGGDPSRVFVTGGSSGGMMTNQLVALYPDVFVAGAAFMAAPFDCFESLADFEGLGDSSCATDRAPQDWGDRVRAVNPDRHGSWPRMQLWHGTSDVIVPYSLLQEEIDQWTNVHGLSQTPTDTDTPRPGWERQRFASPSGAVVLESYSLNGIGHAIPDKGMAAYVIEFFGLDRR